MSNPPALPATLSRPDAQAIVDALNLRLAAVEDKFPVATGDFASGAKAPDADKLDGTDSTGYVAATTESLKIIRGIVDTTGSGSILKGSGFTIARTGTGAVTVSFTAAFSDVPAVTTGCVGPIAAAELGTYSKSSVAVALFNLTFLATDGVFHFIAIGPR